MNILIGNTGLIGTTLKKSISFDYEFNSKNISEYNVPDGCDLYLSCLPATKWLVNKDPYTDLKNAQTIIDIISKNKYNKVYLFSTIDVYCESNLRSDENTVPTVTTLNYGTNRYLFEVMVKQLLKYNKVKIFRLPALYSPDIKKNVLFDFLNNNNVENINAHSVFQWYNLKNLVFDVEYYSSKYCNHTIFNLFPAGIDTTRILNELFPEYKTKVSRKDLVYYDYRTILDSSGYLQSATSSFDGIKNFVNEYRSKSTSV
jgi:hypothetical protein